MLLRIFVLSTLLATTGSVAGLAQSSASDQQGVAVLQKALNASGAALNPIRTFTATGTITYFWAGQPVQGSATIRARGSDQFRLDANLPDGPRSVSTGRQGGNRKNPDGKLNAIPSHNTLSGGTVTLPYPAIAAALADSYVTISYVGLVEEGGRAAHQVRIVRNFPADTDPDGTLARLSRIDYFVDAENFLVLRTEDVIHPVESLTENYSHSIELEGYTVIAGIAVPALVREKVGGQATWEFRLSSISFNTNLQDSDFVLQ